jgi:class 3 adenylate cyclase
MFSGKSVPSAQDAVAQIRDVIDRLTDTSSSRRSGIFGRVQSLQDDLQLAQQGLAQLEQALSVQKEEQQQLQAIQQVGQAIVSSLDLTKVLNMVMDTIVELTGAERGFLMLLDQESGKLIFRVARNMDRETIHRSSFKISRSLVNRVATEGEPIVTTNAQADPRFSAQESVVSYSLRSILCVPLKVHGELVGVIYADNRIVTGLFGDKDRDLLVSFANQAAVAIYNARLFQQVTDQLKAITAMKNLMDNVFASIAVNLNLQLSPLKDAQNDTLGIAMVLDDLTEKRRREKTMGHVRRYLPPALVDSLTDIEDLQLGGARRTISILFGDVRGFSTFSERQGPEMVVDVINSYFTVAAEAILLHEGVIDKFMGDSVMALFNTSFLPQDDHALRAVRSALAVQYDLVALREVLGADRQLQMGIGIHTGDAVLGNIGSPDRLDFSAIGDAVNLAKRLQEVTGPGQILMSQATYEQTREWVEVVVLDPIRVKGRQALEQVAVGEQICTERQFW